MLKLYLRNAGRVTAYHEAWADGSRITEHWGPLGERGKTRMHRRNKKLSEKANLKQVLKPAITAGFEPIDLDDHAILLIEYAIKGMGSVKDLDKRHALEERMNETLGWTGLGHCDGGSIGSGTMEVCCFVVDFETARRVVEKDLKGSKFANYSRIVDERAAEPDDAPAPKKGPAPEATVMYMPPWIMWQGLGRKDAGWLKGKPAQYLARWTRWFQKTPAPAQAAYAAIFHEPKGWTGFYKSVAPSASRSGSSRRSGRST